ncbi:MAG: hypothetical protein E7464_06740 [Ruminococcaceae bacterium]|nr:hypothetical protein [Oscillospiraceae bacterium]
MNKKLLTAMPFIVMPIFLPIYMALDGSILVEVFGCGCVPSIETNMLGIPFNANDLRAAVFTVLTIGLSVWGMFISRRFHRKSTRFFYCLAVILLNAILALWVIKTFVWK